MKKIYLIPLQIIAVLGFFVLLSCGNPDEEESTRNKSGSESDSFDIVAIEKDLIKEQKAEIYSIEKKAVVFFVISKKEMIEMMHEIGDSYRWETEALFNNFIQQANTFQSLLKKHNIPCYLSNSKKFEIKLENGKIVSFNREEKEQILGEIISDGIKDPLIEFGMYSNSELAQLIEGFYKIENLGYIPPSDSTQNKEKQPEPVPE